MKFLSILHIFLTVFMGCLSMTGIGMQSGSSQPVQQSQLWQILENNQLNNTQKLNGVEKLLKFGTIDPTQIKQFIETDTKPETVANPNEYNVAGYTPLIYAIITQNIPLAQLLINYDADLTLGDRGRSFIPFQGRNFSPLHWAVWSNNPTLIHLILNNSKNPEQLLQDYNIESMNPFYTAFNNNRQFYQRGLIALLHYDLFKQNAKNYADAFQKALSDPEFHDIWHALYKTIWPYGSIMQKIITDILHENFERFELNDPQYRSAKEIFEQEIKSKGFPHQLRQREMTGKSFQRG